MGNLNRHPGRNINLHRRAMAARTGTCSLNVCSIFPAVIWLTFEICQDMRGTDREIVRHPEDSRTFIDFITRRNVSHASLASVDRPRCLTPKTLTAETGDGIIFRHLSFPISPHPLKVRPTESKTMACKYDKPCFFALATSPDNTRFPADPHRSVCAPCDSPRTDDILAGKQDQEY